MSDPPPTRRRWFQFGLGTLLLTMILVACGLVIFLQRREIHSLQTVTSIHGLADSLTDLSPQEFRVQVRKLSNSLPPAVYEIVVETVGEATITVSSPSNTSSATSGYGKPVGDLTRSNVLVLADEISDPNVAGRFRYLVQVGSADGGSAGGPAVRSLPQGKKLADVFEVIIEPGVYPRGKPVPMSVLDGEVTTLDVR